MTEHRVAGEEALVVERARRAPTAVVLSKALCSVEQAAQAAYRDGHPLWLKEEMGVKR